MLKYYPIAYGYDKVVKMSTITKGESGSSDKPSRIVDTRSRGIGIKMGLTLGIALSAAGVYFADYQPYELRVETVQHEVVNTNRAIDRYNADSKQLLDDAKMAFSVAAKLNPHVKEYKRGLSELLEYDNAALAVCNRMAGEPKEIVALANRVNAFLRLANSDDLNSNNYEIVKDLEKRSNTEVTIETLSGSLGTAIKLVKKEIEAKNPTKTPSQTNTGPRLVYTLDMVQELQEDEILSTAESWFREERGPKDLVYEGNFLTSFFGRDGKLREK
jgi:hypothetical protein